MPHLSPAHHETSKHDSPNETRVKEKQNETILYLNSNLAKSITHHNQIKELTTWFLSNDINEVTGEVLKVLLLGIEDSLKEWLQISLLLKIEGDKRIELKILNMRVYFRSVSGEHEKGGDGSFYIPSLRCYRWMSET
jgi:hypothetical protein